MKFPIDMSLSTVSASDVDLRGRLLGSGDEHSPSTVPVRGRSSVWIDGWGSGDLLGMTAGVVLTLVISYVFGHGRIFWEDEMLGWMLLHDPSWRHMVSAWKLGADGGGFAFYLTGRPWFAIFGASEIAFRMYSGVCFAIAFLVVWAMGRRFYRVGTVAFALFNVFFFSPPLVLHMAEGRFYGLLMLSTALAAWLAVLPPPAERKGAWKMYGLTFLVHALLTTSHLLGVVYSAFLLAAMFATDVSQNRSRPVLYLCGAASWLLLLPERTAIFASVRVGKPHFWTTQPTFRRFVGVYSAFSIEIAAVLLVLGIAVAVTLWRDRQRRERSLREAIRVRAPIYIVTLALLLVPIAFLIEGFFGPALFISRYLMPVAIGQALLIAEAVRLISWRSLLPSAFAATFSLSKWVTIAAEICYAAALLLWVFVFIKPLAIGQMNYTDALSAMLPRGIPVLCEDAWSFTELIGRQHASGVEYTYLLDWPESTSRDAPRLEVVQYHLMENWRKAGYFGGSIADREPFLARNKEFFVLHTEAWPPTTALPEIGNPLVRRFSRDPEYTVRQYAELDRKNLRETVWLVCAGPCKLSLRGKQ